MIKIKIKHILLYAIGILLLIFGQRHFWEDILQTVKQKESAKKMAEEARVASEKAFEVQQLTYDSSLHIWKNMNPYFQTLHIGKINFKALPQGKKSTVETNDDENASDSI